MRLHTLIVAALADAALIAERYGVPLEMVLGRGGVRKGNRECWQ